MKEIINKTAKRLSYSFYFISVTFIILPLILSYIDRRNFDLLYIGNIILLIMQLLLITYTFFLSKDKLNKNLLKINIVLWMFNIFPTFALYLFSSNCDFEGICTFMYTIRNFTIFLFIIAKFIDLQ